MNVWDYEQELNRIFDKYNITNFRFKTIIPTNRTFSNVLTLVIFVNGYQRSSIDNYFTWATWTDVQYFFTGKHNTLDKGRINAPIANIIDELDYWQKYGIIAREKITDIDLKMLNCFKGTNSIEEFEIKCDLTLGN